MMVLPIVIYANQESLQTQLETQSVTLVTLDFPLILKLLPVIDVLSKPILGIQHHIPVLIAQMVLSQMSSGPHVRNVQQVLIATSTALNACLAAKVLFPM